MPARMRKLIGSLGLVLFIGFWAVASTIVAMGMMNVSRTAQLVFYLVAGLLWVIPAGAIIVWMQKPRPVRASAEPNRGA